jgi:threonine aldolase
MNFASDNVTGAAPEILEALARGNAGAAVPYGNDDVTAAVEARFAELFETECAVFLVTTGTAANALALAAMVPPWGSVLCHRDSHVNVDECGAPEFFAGGAKLVPLPGEHGRLSPAVVAEALGSNHAGPPHRVRPSALSLTQPTEVGTVYPAEDVAVLAEVARGHGMRVHMDGARFANALVTLGCRPADATWRAGVDVLALGGTKNGCLCAEAVVVFDRELARDMAYRRKRAGQLLSKHRFLALQWQAYLADGLWLRLAAHANARAARLAEGLTAVPGVRLAHPVDANEVFAGLPNPALAALKQAGFTVLPWEEGLCRMVTSFDTDPADVEALLAAVREAVPDAA